AAGKGVDLLLAVVADTELTARRRELGGELRRNLPRHGRTADQADAGNPELARDRRERVGKLPLPLDCAKKARQLHLASPDGENLVGLLRFHETRSSTSDRARARSSWSSISIQARPSTRST